MFGFDGVYHVYWSALARYGMWMKRRYDSPQCQKTASPGLTAGTLTIVFCSRRCGCVSSLSSWPRPRGAPGKRDDSRSSSQFASARYSSKDSSTRGDFSLPCVSHCFDQVAAFSTCRKKGRRMVYADISRR
jgi:hypothetical protein